MLKPPGKLQFMQRLQSPQSPGVWGVNQSQGRSPQPPGVRGALERGDKSSLEGLTKVRKESIAMMQLQLLQLRLSNKNQDSKNSSQSGFTLMECLLAIMIVAILLSAVAPAIVLSVATRLQARRVELASQAAQTYIDGVRAGKIPSYLINPVPLNEVTVDTNTGEKTFTPDRATFAATPAPASSELDSTNCLTTNPLYPYCSSPTSTLYCVDLDRDGGCTNTSPRDLIVQAFRSQSPEQVTAEAAAVNNDEWNKIINKNGYLLGVRVYRADSFKNGRTLTGGDGKKDSTFAGGTGLKNEQAPLVEKTTEISSRSSSSESKDTTSYKDMCERLGGCNPTTTTTP